MMSSLSNNTGESDRTNNVGSTILHLFNAYQKKNSEPFLEDMTMDYVEEDNIKILLTYYIN